MIRGILFDQIDDEWSEIKPLLDRAMDYADGKIDSDDIYQSIKSRDMQLWVVPGGIWVTS